ncbi:uncharacterized protein LOC123866757 [Maniola jurtina]|uniref:uncharacterized protein LOC123866757 n=1 Tax=Maniola jurtina TaxID=191418 RepID=UPI001E68CC24|nr:uncharacterized protein LOC123866757 [Maniola jurtina]
MPINDDMEFLGTAEIEEVLNDMKQEEIQMILDQEPTIANLITNAVTETSFTSVPYYIAQSNIFPGYAFSTFLFLSYPNNSLAKNIFKNSKNQMHNKLIRSIKEDSCTLACNIEEKLQRKLKKTYCKLKDKLSKEYNKEIKEARATIKEHIKKTSKHTSKKVCTLPCANKNKQTTEIKSILKTKLMNKYSHINGTRFKTNCTKSMKKLIEGSKFSTHSISTRRIQTPEDEFSMISTFEKLLDRSNGNNMMENIILTTQSNFENTGLRKFAKRNPKSHFIPEENNTEYFYKDGVKIPDSVEYTDCDNNVDNLTATDKITEKYDRSQVTADANYQALSNKISFNDYVNGYKYYLNFQKDNDDEKYSNLVRYQAHKHHNVDDIGKFILTKIPRLPSTRIKRYFVESETLEDQDVSTKSEDSWFKKHFFAYLDTNPPRKFHTSQTVSLKAPDLQTTERTTTRAITMYTHKKITLPQAKNIILTRRHRRNNLPSNSNSEHHVQDNTLQFCETCRRKKKSYNNGHNPRKSESPINDEMKEKQKFYEKLSKHKICKKKIPNKKDYKEKVKNLSSISHRKNGFVNIDLVHRSTGIVKLNKNNKGKSKIQNLFKKLHINRHQPRIFEKDKSNRKQRHIFESLKNIFREKPKQEMKNGLKFFDYKIVTSKERPEEYNNLNSLNFLNVEDIWKQIPTITGDFTYPYYFLHPEVYNNERLFYSRQPKFDLKTKSISFLSGKSFPHFEENRDDVFDVNIITDYTNKPEPAFTVHMKAINNPTLVNMLANKKNAVGNINMKQTAEKDQPIEDHLKKSNKNKLYSINKQTQEKNYDLDKDIENKQSQSIFQPARYFKNYMTERYVSGKPILKSTKKVNPGNQQNKDETKQRNKSVIEQWVPINKVTKIICHTVPFPFSVSMSTKGRNHTSNKLFQYHSGKINDDDSYTLKRRQNKGIYNTKISKPSISSIARVNALPEQYFTTFLPMQINDFHKFLKEKEIDVESVTTPLMNSLPRSLDLWNTKIINSKSKIKESMDSTKKYISRKPTRNSQSLDFLLSPHQNQKNELEFGESVNMINHNQFENSRNQKSIYDRLKRIKSVTGNYVGNILRSQKYLNNIDLDDKMFDEDTKTFVTEKIKHQNDYFTLNDKVSDKDLQLYLSRPNKNRDPLKFSHMSTKRYFPKYFNNNITKKPERVQISGHSYKYDIIYHKPLLHLKEQNSDDKHYADSLIRNFDDDDTYSSVIEKPKVHNIRKTSSHQSQRGTMKLRKALLSNAASKKQVKRRKCKLFHTKACKEDIQNKVIIKNIKNRNISSIIHEKTKQLLPDIKNYDDPKVYFESKPLHKSMKQKNAVSDRIISKHEKRSAQIETFTATDVAAIEVVVDLMKNTPTYDGKDGSIKTYFDNSDQPAHHPVSMSPKEGHVSNSIQVHIAIPHNTDDKKRSLEPVRLRKVFSAVMSTPVDLEYQIHSLEETTTAQTSIVRDILTPGLYLLVENTNISCPEGNFLLKPIRTSLKPSKLAIRYVTSVTEKKNSSPSSVNIERVSFDKDFIDAVYKAIQINGNNSFNNTYSKTRRSLPTEVEKENTGIRSLVLEKKRNINWNLIKKYFGHDKVCHCRCKANQTMCRECVACNAIITELMFELENLAEYMKQHCTEIQTFFWVNPSGGRKLRDLIHRIDKTLNDYYRRVKGKCQGRTCQMISSSIDKRSLNRLCDNNLFNRLSELADNLENVSKYKIFNEEILMSGTKLLNVAKRCMLTRLHKRSGRNTITKPPLDTTILYSLSNIKVNLICNKDFTKPIFGAGNTISSGCENNTNSELYFGDGEMKKMKEYRKGIKAFLKNCFIKKKSRKKIQGAKNRVIRNWTAKDQFAKPLLLINQKPIESNVGKVTKHGRKSLDTLENPNFISNKTHKEENITISENDEVEQYTNDYKYKNNNEINGYMVDTDSFSYNMNELFRLLNNVDALEAYTTKSIFYLNENVTKKASLGSEIGTKTAYTWSKLKTENKPKQNLKVSSNISSKSTLVTKRGKHRNNGSRTKCLNKATKLNFLNRLKLLEFLLKKDQVKNKTNSPFTTPSENRRLQSHISKYTKHQSQTEKKKITTSPLLINMDDDNNTFSNELTTTRRSFKKLHSKNASFLSIPMSIPNLIQDKKVKPDNMEGSSENIKDTQFESLNHSTNNCKSGTQKTNKDYTFNYKNILQSLKNIHNNNIFNYTIFDTEPKNYKGIVSKIADQFVIKILPDREINKGSQKCHNCTYTTTSKHNNGKSCLQSVEKNHENISKSHKDEAKPQSTLTALIQSTASKTIQEKNYKDKMKEKDTQNTSNFSLKEADDRNNICDIAATINHVEKMHDSMPKEDFEQYVKSLSCHKYKNMPRYISIKYNTITKHTKYHRKRKTCRKDYKNILKWDWIRDKRSLIVDDTRVELDDYEDNEKSNNTEPHKAAHDVWHNNAHKKYSSHGSNKKDNKSIEIITIRDKHNQKYFDDSKHRVRKRSLLSLNSSRNEKDYHRAIDHNKRTGLKEPFYELYFKRKGGIYQQSYDRRKRSNMNNLTDLRRDLQNLPPLRPLSDEIFVTMGDPVTLDCHQPGNRPNYSVSDYIWNTERDEMLDHENIVVDGSKVFIRDVAAKNFGTYVCSKGNAVIRSLKVTIISIPSFNIVFTPVYRTDSACTYKELKAVQMLNSEISRECCGKYCSVRIDEPICLKDREDESSYLRPIVVISLNAIPNISCSCECKRNLQCSITRLLVSNMPSLAFVKVLIIFDSMSTNKTLTPLHGSKRRSFVTHTLRRKDSNGHYEYRNIAARMDPGNFDLVLLCPAGFYLISEQKICVVCPSNTFSEEGANICRTCPQGTRAAPGSKFCRLQHLRWGRFVWNANEWSIATFFALALSAFAICYGAIYLLWRRACRSQGNNTCNSRGNTRLGRTKPCQKSPRRRSGSPSHVILSRLLRGSMTSSRATDSQENRFELWKEKNTLPPLPPIDFDL